MQAENVDVDTFYRVWVEGNKPSDNDAQGEKKDSKPAEKKAGRESYRKREPTKRFAEKGERYTLYIQ